MQSGEQSFAKGVFPEDRDHVGRSFAKRQLSKSSIPHVQEGSKG